MSLGIGVFHRQKTGLIYDRLGFERMDLYCATGNPLFEATGAAEVQEGMKSTLYAKRAYLRERNVAPISRGLNRSAHAHQIEGIAHLILTGKYIGYLPVDFADIWVRDGRMRAVGGGKYGQPSELKLVKKRGAELGRAAQVFEKMLMEQ